MEIKRQALLNNAITAISTLIIAIAILFISLEIREKDELMSTLLIFLGAGSYFIVSLASSGLWLRNKLASKNFVTFNAKAYVPILSITVIFSNISMMLYYFIGVFIFPFMLYYTFIKRKKK